MIQKFLNFYIYLIILSLPLYLIKIKIWFVPFSVLELMIYGLFALWFFYRVKNYKVLWSNFSFGRRVAGYEYPIFLIFLGVTISTLFSDNLQASAGIWKGWFLVPILFFFILLDVIRSQKQIRDALTALTLSGFFTALISLEYWFSDNLTYDGRLKGFYLSPNYLAMYLSPILIMSFGLWGFIKNKKWKILLLSNYFLLSFVIYLTYSRGAWLGLFGASLLALIIRARSFGAYHKIIFTIILLLVASPFFYQFWVEEKLSLESRLMIWRVAAEIIKDHPLIGIGPGMFQDYYLKYQPRFKPYLDWTSPQPHNLFLAFWLQTGLIGLIGFIWLIVLFFKKHYDLHHHNVLIAVMSYALVHGLFDTTYFKNDLAVIFWLIIALASIVNHLSYLERKDNLLLGR